MRAGTMHACKYCLKVILCCSIVAHIYLIYSIHDLAAGALVGIKHAFLTFVK